MKNSMQGPSSLSFFVFSLLITTLISSQAFSQAKKSSLPPGAELSTDLRFDPSNVYGRHNHAGEAVVTVEDDKLMERLLGLRTHFKDRLKETSDQHSSRRMP